MHQSTAFVMINVNDIQQLHFIDFDITLLHLFSVKSVVNTRVIALNYF
jgi:hypothetical protein